MISFLWCDYDAALHKGEFKIHDEDTNIAISVRDLLWIVRMIFFCVDIMMELRVEVN